MHNYKIKSSELFLYLLDLVFADSVNFATRRKKDKNSRADLEGPFTLTANAVPNTSKPRLDTDSSLPLFSLSHKYLLLIAIFTVWLATRCKGSVSHILDSKSERNSAPGPVLSEVIVPMLELRWMTRNH